MLLAFADPPAPASLQNLQVWMTWLKVAVSLGVVTTLGVVCKYSWNLYRWRHFKNSVNTWFRFSAISDVDHPKEMSPDDWKALSERMLLSARFSPFEIQQLIELAVVTAKGIVFERLV